MQPTYLSAVARASEDKMAAKMAHTGAKMADTVDSYSLDRPLGSPATWARHLVAADSRISGMMCYAEGFSGAVVRQTIFVLLF